MGAGHADRCGCLQTRKGSTKVESSAAPTATNASIAEAKALSGVIAMCVSTLWTASGPRHYIKEAAL
jgi:hypothetical protein